MAFGFAYGGGRSRSWRSCSLFQRELVEKQSQVAHVGTVLLGGYLFVLAPVCAQLLRVLLLPLSTNSSSLPNGACLCSMVATLESYVCSLRIFLSLLSRELYSRSKKPIQGGVGGASGSGRTPVFKDVLQVVFDWQLEDLQPGGRLEDLQPGSSDKRQGDSQGCFGQWLSDLVGNAVHQTSQKVAVVRIITKPEGRPVLLSVVQKQSVQEVLTPTTTTTTHYYYYYYYYYYYSPLNTHLLPVSYLGGSLVAGLPAVNWGSWGRF